MNSAKQFLYRWKTDYDFKTFVSASGSLIVTALFALYNGFLGIYHTSLWHFAICAYYIILVILRGMIITAANRISLQEKQKSARNKVCLKVSILLLLLNISLILPVSMMVRQQKPVHMTLIPAITMAAYTTYKIIMASVNLKKRNISSDSLVRLLRTINFVDALVSILTLQNTLIMVHSNGVNVKMLPLTAVTSATAWMAVLFLSISSILNAVRRIRFQK